MCFDERNTESRSRVPAAALMTRRTRAVRRSVWVRCLAMVASSLPLRLLVGDQRPHELAHLSPVLGRPISLSASHVDRHPQRYRPGGPDQDLRQYRLAIRDRGHFFLPSLRKMYSPAYFTPLPLYGSGLRKPRISAATCPTCWRSMPVITTSVGFGVATAMPFGIG